MARQRLHVIVEGRVQGVFFRASTEEQARKLGLGGWVCNRPDGSVEAVLEGEPAVVQQMIKWLRQGPRLATVTRLQIQEEEPLGVNLDFVIRY